MTTIVVIQEWTPDLKAGLTRAHEFFCRSEQDFEAKAIKELEDLFKKDTAENELRAENRRAFKTETDRLQKIYNALPWWKRRNAENPRSARWGLDFVFDHHIGACPPMNENPFVKHRVALEQLLPIADANLPAQVPGNLVAFMLRKEFSP